jgi:hypothetical protein
MDYRVIKNLDELTTLAAAEGGVEVAISIAGGAVVSSKRVHYLPPREGKTTGRFWVWSEIDDTEQTLWPKQLWTLSTIGEAMDRGALFVRE